MTSATATRDHRLRRLARGRGRAMVMLGGVILALGILIVLAWKADNSGHGERAILLLGGAPLVLFGAALVIGGAFEWLLLPGYRVVRWLPLGAIAGCVCELTDVGGGEPPAEARSARID